MGLRELMETRRGVMVGAIILVIAGAATYGWWSGMSSGGMTSAGEEAFYSIDDGANFFTAPADKIPPFDYRGKSACRARVFTCDGGKKKFVGYLERYTEAARQQMQAAGSEAASKAKSAPLPGMAVVLIEVKKPGAGNVWVAQSSRAGVEVMQVKCPDGGSGTPEPVEP